MKTVKVFETPEQLAQYAAEFLRRELAEHQTGFRYSIALSGGSTPKRMYQSFAEMANAGALCRERADFFFSDERAVGPESEESNFLTAYLGLFRPLGLDERTIHRMKGEAKEFGAEASRYEELIKARLAHQTRKIPAFDLIFLGLGADGHTASLFPDFNFDMESESLVLAPFVSSLGTYRLTLSLKLINQARQVMFMVTGREKEGAVTKALSDSIKHDILPASRVNADRTIWLLDRDAAGQLIENEIDGIEIAC